MSWTRGGDINLDRAGIKIGNVETSVDERMAPYTLGQQSHIVMTVDTGGSAAGQTQIHLYKDGVYRGTRITQHALTSLNDVNNFLGRSQYGDNTANASWNEFRIYDYVLNSSEIQGNYLAGPDLLGVIPEPGTLALLGLGLSMLAARRRRRRS